MSEYRLHSVSSMVLVDYYDLPWPEVPISSIRSVIEDKVYCLSPRHSACSLISKVPLA